MEALKINQIRGRLGLELYFLYLSLVGRKFGLQSYLLNLIQASCLEAHTSPLVYSAVLGYHLILLLWYGC